MRDTLSALFTPALNGVNFRLAALKGSALKGSALKGPALKGPALKGPKNLNFFRKVLLIF